MTASTTKAPVLACEAVQKVYGAGGPAPVVALAGVDLAVAAGELIAIVGPSGSGKSSLLHLMGALDTPTGGRVLFEGRDTSQLSEDERTLMRRDRLGFVFQFFNLLPLLSACENVAMPLYLAGRAQRAADARAEELLERVGLSDRAHHLPEELSGGERQRLAIARAMVAGPRLILADEPTGNLDRTNGVRILDLFSQLVTEDGVPVVVVTHDPVAAERADRMIQLVDGRIVDRSA